MASNVEARMKTIWNALRDISLNVDQTGRLHRPHHKIHQAGEEENSRRQDSINHFSLRDQMHEVTSHEKAFYGGDEQRDRDRHDVALEVHEVHSDSENRASQQRAEHGE